MRTGLPPDAHQSMGAAKMNNKLTYSAEQALIGMLLTNEASRAKILRSFEPDVFTDAGHRDAFLAMRSLHDKGEIIWPRSVVNAMPEPCDKYLTYLVEIATNHPETVAKVMQPDVYARVLYDEFHKRKKLDISEALRQTATNDGKNWDVAFSGAVDEIRNLRNPFDGNLFEDNAESVRAAFQASKESSKLRISTGLKHWDDRMDGLFKGGMYVLAGHPGVSKTGLALNIAWNVATAGKKVRFFSYEEVATHLWWRIFSRVTRVPITAYRNNLTEHQEVRHIEHQDEFINSPLSIVDSVRKAEDMAPYCDGADLIVIDSASMVSARGGESEFEKANRIGEFATHLAKDFNAAVILLAHVNNESMKQEKGGLTSIYGGQGLVKPASAVVELRRSMDATSPDGVVIDAHIHKNRYKDTGGKMQFVFTGEYMTYRDF